jgi:hypothetical protein
MPQNPVVCIKDYLLWANRYQIWKVSMTKPGTIYLSNNLWLIGFNSYLQWLGEVYV